MAKRIMTCALVALLFCGCTRVSIEQEIDTSTSDTVSNDLKVNNLDINYDAIQLKLNDISNIIDIGFLENEIYVIADYLYILDMANSEIITTVNIPPTMESGKLYKTQYGYTLVATILEDDNISEKCIVYDDDFNYKKEIDIFEEYGLQPMSDDSVTVRNNGQIIINDFAEGICVCSDNGTKSILVSIDSLGNMGIDSIKISSDSNYIVFLGQKITDSTAYNAEYGAINLDTGDIFVNDFSDGEFCRMEYFSEGVIFSEDLPTNGGCGYTYYYNPSSNITKRISLNNNDESMNVWGAYLGDYYITFREKQFNLIQFYDIDGTLLNEESIELHYPAENYKRPYAYINGKYGLIILQYRYDDQQEFHVMGM